MQTTIGPRGALLSLSLIGSITVVGSCASRPPRGEKAGSGRAATAAAGLKAELVAASPVAPHALAVPASASVAPQASVAVPAPVAPKDDARPGVRKVGRCDKPGGVQRITIAHFNDLQARYGEMIAGKSRYAYIAGYLRQIKSEGPTLVLDAGDDYEKGSIAELRSMGETTRQMIQALPIDVRTIGNHDFAYGEAALLRDLSMSQHPVLAANVHRGEDKAGGPFLPFVRVDVGCVKVGVIGLTTLPFGADDEQNHEPYFGVLHHDDSYYQLIGELIQAHKSEVDVMIALTHLGKFLDTDLAKAHGWVDFFVGGHSEDLLADLDAQRIKDKTHAYVLQVGHYGKYLGRADIAVYPNKQVTLERYRLVTVDESLPVASDVHDLAVRLEREVTPDAHLPIATVQSEVASGVAMVELVRKAVADRWGADGLLLGTDVFFDSLPAGPLTLQRLYDTVFVQREPAGTPGYSSLYVVNMTGAEINALKPKVHGYYMFHVPESIVSGKTYKIAVEKRALAFPSMPFITGAKFGTSRFAGELIDVLEAYARARTAKGLPL